ncbi:MAG TPA: hypothetical protein VF116_15610 [Ktedonobacterales bacterium]
MPPTAPSDRGYRRIVGELQQLGLDVSATTVRKVLKSAGIPPAEQRQALSWRQFLRHQAASVWACDFFTVETLFLQRLYVLFFISLERRRIEHLAITGNPSSSWVTQQARNLTGEHAERSWTPPRFLIHDRDSKFSMKEGRGASFDLWGSPPSAPWVERQL